MQNEPTAPEQISEFEEIEELKESIEDLGDKITQTNSPKRLFFKGIFTGLGGAVGATIIFAIMISAVSWFITKTDMPWVTRVLENIGLSDLFNK